MKTFKYFSNKIKQMNESDKKPKIISRQDVMKNLKKFESEYKNTLETLKNV